MASSPLQDCCSCLLSKQPDAMLGSALSGNREWRGVPPGFEDVRFSSGCENPHGKNDELMSAELVKEEGECWDESVRNFPDGLYQ